MKMSWSMFACLCVGWSLRILVCPAAVLAERPGAGTDLSAGEQFQVNSYTTGAQYRPEIAASVNGGFIVAWESMGSPGTDSDRSSIQARRLGPDGTPLGGDFQVNTYTPSVQNLSDVAVLEPDGDFIVTWDSRGSPGTDSDLCSIQARRFSSNGAPRGDQAQVNTYTSGFQAGPRVAGDAEGNFVVAWYAISGDHDVYLQRFAADGSRPGVEQRVNSFTAGRQVGVAVAKATDGSFVVVWGSEYSDGTDNSDHSVRGRRMGADGSFLGEEFQVNSYTTGFQGQEDVAMDAGGNFVVVWQSGGSGGTDTFGYSIQGQRFDASGSPLGRQFQVNSSTEHNYNVPSVTMASDGFFVVVWGGRSEIKGQLFAPQGAPIGGELLINSHTTGGTLSPDVAMSGDSSFVVVWRSGGSPGSDADRSSIQGRRFSDVPESCMAGPTSVCLQGGRFRAEVTWTDFSGNSGAGQAMPATDDTGYFWFFDQDNVELVVKVLDGTGVNGHFWLFYGSLTNVEFELTVTDTYSGAAKTYFNPLGQLASSGDIEAFLEEGF